MLKLEFETERLLIFGKFEQTRKFPLNSIVKASSRFPALVYLKPAV